MKNDLLLDGAPIQIGVKGSYAPPMDAVQEFSVQQNSVDAEFGHSYQLVHVTPANLVLHRTDRPWPGRL